MLDFRFFLTTYAALGETPALRPSRPEITEFKDSLSRTIPHILRFEFFTLV